MTADTRPSEPDAATLTLRKVLREMAAVVGDRLAPTELVGILFTPQPALRERTPAEMILAGDAAPVIALLQHLMTEDDRDAPILPGWYAVAAAHHARISEVAAWLANPDHPVQELVRMWREDGATAEAIFDVLLRDRVYEDVRAGRVADVVREWHRAEWGVVS